MSKNKKVKTNNVYIHWLCDREACHPHKCSDECTTCKWTTSEEHSTSIQSEKKRVTFDMLVLHDPVLHTTSIQLLED